MGVNVNPYRRKVFCSAGRGASPLVKIAAPPCGEGACGAGGADQRVEAARDRRRRIDEADRPGGKPLEPIDDERKVGAGEHDVVGAPAVAFDETWRDLARDLGILDRFAAHDRVRR